MIKEARRREILKKRKQVKKLETQLSNARSALVAELRGARLEDKPSASYQELGQLIDLSRQRIFQLIDSGEM